MGDLKETERPSTVIDVADVDRNTTASINGRESRVSTATSQRYTSSAIRDQMAEESVTLRYRRGTGKRSLSSANNTLGLIIESPRTNPENNKKRLRRKLNTRSFKKLRKGRVKLPRIDPTGPEHGGMTTPDIIVGPQPPVTIHHPQLGRIERGGRLGAMSGRHLRSAHRQSLNPHLRIPLPTIQENSEGKRDIECEQETSIPPMQSLVTAYKNLTFAHQMENDDKVTAEFAHSGSGWQTLPMQSELDKYVSFLSASKRQTHAFSKQVMPGLGFQRGAIGRPKSPQQSFFERQRTRFGQDVLWNNYNDSVIKRKTQASKLKSAQGRTDRLVSKLKNVLHDKI